MATTLTVTATSFALAQDPGHMHHIRAGVNDGNERQFLFASDLALSDMSRAMLIPPSADVDRDFVAMMIPRDQATIDMAHAELQYGHDDELRRLAQSIVDRQQREISMMSKPWGTPGRVLRAGCHRPSAGPEAHRPTKLDLKTS